MKKKLLWYSYDFANSFASVAIVFYIPLILSEKGVADYWIGIPSSIATLILLIIMPYFGFISDKVGKKMYFLRYTSLLMVLSIFGLSYVTQNSLSLSSGIFWFVTFYILFWIFFQAGLIFYSAMLKSISEGEKGHHISGIGIAFGQLGNAVGLYIMGLIIATGVGIFGIYDKSLALLIGAIAFIVIAFTFLITKDNFPKNNSLIKFSYKEYVAKILSNKKIMWALIAYTLLADSILTFQIYLTVYTKKVFYLSDSVVVNIGILGLLFAMFGGAVSGIFIKRFGMSKTIIISILLYIVGFITYAIIPAISVMIYLSMMVAGFAYGALFSSYRAYYARITPENEQSEYFSIYSVFERAASVIGPLVWSLTFYFGSLYSENFAYRFSLLSLVIVIILGLIAFNKSKRIELTTIA